MNANHWVYVYSAYTLVLIALMWQWLVPWRRWHHYYRKQIKKR